MLLHLFYLRFDSLTVLSLFSDHTISLWDVALFQNGKIYHSKSKVILVQFPVYCVSLAFIYC